MSTKVLSLERNATDILEALKELQRDHTKAQKIAHNGYEIVRRALRPENVRR